MRKLRPDGGTRDPSWQIPIPAKKKQAPFTHRTNPVAVLCVAAASR
jgi:hypothetical protein